MGSAVWMVACLALSGCVHGGPVTGSLPDVAPGRYEKTLTSGGFARRYVLRVPPGYRKEEPTPVVVMLHGFTGSGATFEKASGMGTVADREGFVSVFPDGLGNPRGWNAGFLNLTGKKVDDVAFIAALLDELARTVNVDPARVFVAGHSNGAMMANLVGARLSDRVAAIGVVAGLVGLTPSTMPAEPAKPVSVIMIHGKLDPLVAFDAAANSLLHGVPVLQGAKWWAKQDGASDVAVVDRSKGVTTQTWILGKEGAEVRLVTVDNGQHEWPSRGMLGQDAATMLIEFFKSHPKRG